MKLHIYPEFFTAVLAYLKASVSVQGLLGRQTRPAHNDKPTECCVQSLLAGSSGPSHTMANAGALAPAEAAVTAQVAEGTGKYTDTSAASILLSLKGEQGPGPTA